MICPKCKNEVRSNIHICPQCGSLVNVTKEETKSKSIKTAKHVKSKLASEDQSTLVGGTISKESFIKISRKPTKEKEILRKDYNNYIDYKEAKERAIEEMKKPNSSKTRSVLSSIVGENNTKSSGTVSGKAIKKQPDKKKDIKVVEKKNAINPLITNFFGHQEFNTGNKKQTKKGALSIEKVSKDKRYKTINTLASICVIVIWVLTVYYLVTKPEISYYFHENNEAYVKASSNENTQVDKDMLEYESVSKSGQTGGYTSDGVTSIVYDNQYLKQFSIKRESDITKLISTDSVKQKTNCPSNITKIENEIITNYGIIAVNLCEMEESFAIELKEVIGYIYSNFPSARNYLTNVTLANVEAGATYMAAFMPVFTFATSPGNTGYPIGVKSQIILNAKYFLDSNRIRNSISYGSRSGYFPPNATRSSAVAHEFGHYLSYVALLNHYRSNRLMYVTANSSKMLYDVYKDFNDGYFSYDLLNEAYNEYKKSYPNESFDEFRGSISTYAIAKDSSGNYVYDETIAEAFHDVYLNGANAKPASVFIVNKLKEKL